jgi:hypothetical protein
MEKHSASLPQEALDITKQGFEIVITAIDIIAMTSIGRQQGV